INASPIQAGGSVDLVFEDSVAENVTPTFRIESMVLEPRVPRTTFVHGVFPFGTDTSPLAPTSVFGTGTQLIDTTYTLTQVAAGGFSIQSPGSTATTAVINGSLTLNTDTAFVVADGTAPQDVVVNATLMGAGKLLKQGAGTLVLAGTSPSYTGTMRIDAGTL